jgi:AcrR family transcriptional regulator
MTSLDRRLRHKQQIRQQILDVANKIANQEGWSAVTMRRIATAIEYTLPVIYTHFKSKEEIIATLANQGFEELKLALSSKSIAEAKTPKDALHHLAKAYTEFAKKEKALYSAMFGLEGLNVFSSHQNGQKNELTEYLEGKFGEFKKNGLKIKDNSSAASIFWANLHGFASLDLLGLLGNNDKQLDKLVTESVDLLISSWS